MSLHTYPSLESQFLTVTEHIFTVLSDIPDNQCHNDWESIILPTSSIIHYQKATIVSRTNCCSAAIVTKRTSLSAPCYIFFPWLLCIEMVCRWRILLHLQIRDILYHTNWHSRSCRTGQQCLSSPCEILNYRPYSRHQSNSVTSS